MHNTSSPAALRAEIAFHRCKLYHLAPIVGVHPVRLGQMLNERVPMPPGVADRLRRALERFPDMPCGDRAEEHQQA